jgi:hypothetical protein
MEAFMNGSLSATGRQPTVWSIRGFAFAAALGLLAMAVAAPIAQFGILNTLVVPTDATATATNIAGSLGLFGTAVAIFFLVAILDVVVALALYVVLGRVNRSLALVATWLRVIYAAVFAVALLSLWNVVGLLSPSAAATASVTSQVTSSIASFNTVWDLGLVVFGIHLLGLGALLVRAPLFGRLIGALVVIAGLGYMVDATGRLLIPGYSLTLSMVTFVGEALLIIWLFRFAIRAGRPGDSRADRPSEAFGATS